MIQIPNGYKCRQEIIEKGWLEICLPTTYSLAEFAANIGTILPDAKGNLTTVLKQKKADSVTNSLSSRFGYGAFPFHTDGVGFPVPPNILLLRALDLDKSQQSTDINVVSWPEEGSKDYSLLANTPIIFNLGATRFYSPILNRAGLNRTEFIRYNPCCMVYPPIAKVELEKAIETLLEKAKIKKIQWVEEKIIAINNWRVLHGRGQVTHVKYIGNRTLERCWVM